MHKNSQLWTKLPYTTLKGLIYMKQQRIHHTSQRKPAQKPKGLYYLAVFLLVTVCCVGYINSRRSAMQEEVDKSFSVNPTQTETEVPHLPDMEVAIPDFTEMDTPEEMPEEDPQPETAPVSAEDITFGMPVAGEVAKDFSGDELVFNDTMNDWRTHPGVDIKADMGVAVTAAAAGTIEDIYADPLYGTTVVIRHSDKLITRYAGLQPSLPISKGNFVEAGAPIGNIGNSAVAEKEQDTHLHFEVIENNIPINPMDLF